MQAQRPEPTWSLAWQCTPVISALLWWAGRWTGESQEAWGLEYTLVNHEETLTQKDRSRGLTLENLISTCAMAHTCTQADYAEVYVLCLNGSVKGLVHDYAHKTAGRLWYGLCPACPLMPLFCRGLLILACGTLLGLHPWALSFFRQEPDSQSNMLCRRHSQCHMPWIASEQMLLWILTKTPRVTVSQQKQ